jgi:hypothetical protein
MIHRLLSPCAYYKHILRKPDPADVALRTTCFDPQAVKQANTVAAVHAGMRLPPAEFVSLSRRVIAR